MHISDPRSTADQDSQAHYTSPCTRLWLPMNRKMGRTSLYSPINLKLLTKRGSVQFSWVQSLSRVRLFATPWVTARQASLSITNSRSSLKLMSIELVMPYSHLILCHPLIFLPPIPPSIRVFSNELTLHMRWPKYWSFSFSISPSNEHPGLISFRMKWLTLLAVQGTLKSLQHHSSKASILWCSAQLSSKPVLQRQHIPNQKEFTSEPFQYLLLWEAYRGQESNSK